MSEADWAAVRARQALDAARLVSEPNLLPGDAAQPDAVPVGVCFVGRV